MHSSTTAIETDGLVKVFGDVRAVDGIDLTVPAGIVHGFLGPNGAGKTTTVRMLATLLRPDAGSARVFGHDVGRERAEVRRRIALTGQSASVDEHLTGLENLVMVGRLLGRPWKDARARAAELLAAFELDEAANRLVKGYSGGMRRRLDIAAGIVVSPDLLFLDEPTAGLDPRSRSEVWNVVRALVAAGTTVLLTTQYLDEADRLADRVTVIDRGRVIAEGTPGELKASVGNGALTVRVLDPARREEAGRLIERELRVPVRLEPDPVALSAQVSDLDRIARALAELSRAGLAVTDFALSRPSLDEVFLALTGRRPEPDAAPDAMPGTNEEDVA
ncbi:MULTISPECIES: ATP-binding cassette domain-containing protein [Actinomadura]|uniref:ATP-binding cassette domain-containing protein n=1 Tax=Actinomadura yumaensis TaxID=111807 RepID=A0ABW2CME2_9ACTN|nr:ATP-binding cassette domain-containing protein [Actinomadura sp. J1-007]MWK36510.1 ATP-binding cassette domain-containing protein [Actinomadura sp. J1-007]